MQNKSTWKESERKKKNHDGKLKIKSENKIRQIINHKLNEIKNNQNKKLF